MNVRRALTVILIVLISILLIVTIWTFDLTIAILLLSAIATLASKTFRGGGKDENLSNVEREVLKAIFSGFKTIDLISKFTGYSKVKVEMALKRLVGRGFIEEVKLGNIRVYNLKSGKLPTSGR